MVTYSVAVGFGSGRATLFCCSESSDSNALGIVVGSGSVDVAMNPRGMLLLGVDATPLLVLNHQYNVADLNGDCIPPLIRLVHQR